MNRTNGNNFLENEHKLDLLCFSHLGWNHVYQRPQHLLSRFAAARRVFYIEEPDIGPGPSRWLASRDPSGVRVLIPYLDIKLDKVEARKVHCALIGELLDQHNIRDYIAWYYTPMAVDYTRYLQPALTIYDCMDELSAFKGASLKMRQLEAELFQHSDLVFTGGRSLYRAKQGLHANLHCFPSSIDYAHFSQARQALPEPADQARIPHPRLGYYGVVDERMDLPLLAAVAGARPEWHILLVGPVVKLETRQLPRRSNLHYLGQKPYASLPAYLAGWDAALLPFAINAATRFVSPTKIPEYLAGGKPVVSTPITDVVHPYGELGLVSIAAGPEDFVTAVQAALDLSASRPAWLKAVDDFLAQTSWDKTWQAMDELIWKTLQKKTGRWSRLPDRAALGAIQGVKAFGDPQTNRDRADPCS